MIKNLQQLFPRLFAAKHKNQSISSEISPEFPTLPKSVEAPIVVEAWHGSGLLFEQFSTSMVGSGEGALALGWGLYFSEDRKIGEYNARRRRFERKGDGFLYQVRLSLDQSRIINLSDPKSLVEHTIVEKYRNLQLEIGMAAAARWLQRTGVQAVRAYEQECGATGDSIVCIDDRVIAIQARYAFNPPASWQLL